MVHTFSKMFPLGETAPNFSLINVIDNNKISLDDVKSDKATVIMFICAHCPYVKHYNKEIASISKEYSKKGISFVAISSNDAEAFPGDSPVKLKEQAQEFGFTFPYLYDETQLVAKAYMAACTPDFYIFNNEMKCVYRGQLDDSRPKNDLPVTGKDLRKALDAIIKGSAFATDQKPSSGCNIKWKTGVSPF